MATDQRESPTSLVARPDPRLIAIPDEIDGEAVVRYFVDAVAARAFVDERMAAGQPLSWVGAWCDLDDEEFDRELDRIRHESRPTPPIEDDDLGL